MRDSSGHDMVQTDGVGLIVYGGTREELQRKLRERDDRIAGLEALIAKAVKHADSNGMGEWTVFKALWTALTKTL